MNHNTLKLFHELMKHGFIDRIDNGLLWNMVEDPEARDELDEMGRELGFEILPAQNRIYLVPTQDNDLFLKNNADYRADIKATSDTRARDLYLMNYLAIYILFEFFKGKDADACVTDFLLKEDLISEFTKHCEIVEKRGIDGENSNNDFGDSFIMLARDWLGKMEGDPGSKRFDDKYGILNKIITKFKADDLFVDEGGRISPTKKTKDIMPYILRKDRVKAINQWMEAGIYATDQ